MKRVLLFLFLLSSAVCCVFAQTFESGGIRYAVLSSDDKTVAVERYCGDSVGNVVIPQSVKYDDVEYSVKEINDGAFYHFNRLSSISIPDGVTSIGYSAFMFCGGLTSIQIPKSVTSIQSDAFAYCDGVTSIKVDRRNPVYDSRKGCNAIIETSTNTLFTGCKNTVIPKDITKIGDCAFYGCTGLNSVTIPDGVTSIGFYAFRGCNGLKSINIPSSVKLIVEYAFMFCKGLVSVNISEGVESIENNAFWSCSALKSVKIPASVSNIETEAFGRCTSLASIVIHPDNAIYDSRENCNAIIETSTNTLIAGCKNTVIPNGITCIGPGAFNACSDLTSITIPDGVTEIWYEAFRECSSLKKINIPSSVTDISHSVFYDCDGLMEMTVSPQNSTYDSRDGCNAIIETASNTLIFACNTTVMPKSITGIGPMAFSRLTGLTEIVIPDGVTSIGYNAFESCSSLASITIPSSVTGIEFGVFNFCSNLTQVVSKIEKPFELERNPFFRISDDCVLTVPAGTRDAYIAAGWTEEMFKGGINVGFDDIADVFADVKANETVVFLLRHGERGRDYSKAGLLTENGKAQARMVGEKIKSGEQAFYAHSDYGRTIQTCENIAMGRGDEFIHEEWGILNGDWYRRDIPAIKRNGWDNWESLSQWAYEGGHEEGFYDLEYRSKEWLDSLKAHLPGMKRINVLISHDYMVTPMAVYASDKQVDLHYWVNRKWINYLAGIAIIIDPEGNMRFKIVRGLDSGVLGR